MTNRGNFMADDKQVHQSVSRASYAPWRRTCPVKQSFMKSTVRRNEIHELPTAFDAIKTHSIPQGWTDQTLLQTIDRNNTQQTPKAADELVEAPYKSNNKIANNPDKPSNSVKLPSQCCANCFCDCKSKYFSTKSGPRANEENETSAAENVASELYKVQCSKQRNCLISGGVELVPLLAKRRAMQRPISLSTTDVTKYPTERK